MESEPTPITCKLTSIELQRRKTTVVAELRQLVIARTELADGFSYEFEATESLLDKLNTFVKAERRCCDFFKFQLTIEGTKALLSITGPEGTKKFITEEIDF
jgi:hypothetical protein